MAGQNPTLDRIVVYFQDTYFWKGLVPVLVLAALFFGPEARENSVRQNVIGTLIAVFAAVFVARVLQTGLPFVERPFNTPGLTLNSAPTHSDAVGGNSSFPSDHALMFFAMATCILQYARFAGILLIFHAVIVVSLPRIYLGLHWPSDIAAGAALGILLALLLQRPLANLIDKLGISDWPETRPILFYLLFFVAMIETANMYIGLRNLLSLAVDLI